MKVAITRLAMDLQLSKFAISQYIKKLVKNIFEKKSSKFNSFAVKGDLLNGKPSK